MVANRNPRTGIGYFEPGHYCLVVVDGRDGDSAPGASIEEFASVFESLGCTQAYNLDGGGSSLFLDYSIDGIRRKEYLKMYLVPEKNKIDKELNRQTLEAAETIRAKRIIDIQKGVAGIPKGAYL